MGEFRAKVKGAVMEAASVVQGRPGIFALLAARFLKLKEAKRYHLESNGAG